MRVADAESRNLLLPFGIVQPALGDLEQHDAAEGDAQQRMRQRDRAGKLRGDADLVFADRQSRFGALLVFVALDALFALAVGTRGIGATRVVDAADALVVVADGLCRRALRVGHAFDALALRDVAHALVTVLAVRVGVAAEVTLVIVAAQRGSAAIGVDQALVALALRDVAGRFGGGAIRGGSAGDALCARWLADRFP